jgi:hypothetical protein
MKGTTKIMMNKLIASVIAGAFLLPLFNFNVHAAPEQTDRHEEIYEDEIIYVDFDSKMVERVKFPEETAVTTKTEGGDGYAETTKKSETKAPEPQKKPAETSKPSVQTSAPAVTEPPVTAAPPVMTELPVVTAPIAEETSAPVTETPEEVPPIEESAENTDIPDASEATPEISDLINPQKGNADLIEDVSGDLVDREFIAVQSKNGAVFYIVIDRDGKEENVYFMNLVDEYDLQAFAENFPEETAETVPESEEPEADEPAPETPKEKKNSSPVPLIIAIGVVVAIVYFKVIKSKKTIPSKGVFFNDDEDEEDDEEETVRED